MTTVNVMVDTPTGRVSVTALLAATPEEHARGYIGREEPEHDHCGVLFVFSHSARRTFHMHGVPFDLDLIIGDKSGAALGAAHMETNSPRVYTSKVGIDWALEVRSGWVQRHGAPTRVLW